MSPSRTYAVFLIICTRLIYGLDITKKSLAFVIDDTGSMQQEISQVKECVNSIFEAVASSKESPVQHFILVTFNDYSWLKSSDKPDTRLLTITKDRDVFKSALASIKINGGDDCPEFAMKGIKMALENSLPYSLLYVFTDASAKDYKKFEEVRSLAIKKSIQVTFLLTGECSSKSDAAYQVYYKLARSTGGEVFNMMKSEVKEVLNYVKQNIKSINEVLFSAKFPPGKNTFNITVDAKTKDVIVSASGEGSKIAVKNPDGKKADLEHIVDTENIKIVKLRENKTGVHTADVDSKTGTTVKVTGTSSVKFQHGFSKFVPTSLDETAIRPAPDGYTYLSIKTVGEGVTFETAKILDLDNNVIQELPLRLIDKNLYLSALFDPPSTIFHIEVHGYDDNDKTPIKRITTTPVQRQNLKLEPTAKNVAPTTVIQNAPKITTNYYTSLQLKCKVHGYPKPYITWQENSTGVILPATVERVEIPYDYISILNIQTTKNSTYTCKATNLHGVNLKHIKIEVPKYFHVVEKPKKVIVIKYGDEGRIVCKIDAQPPPNITWYKDGRILSSGDNIQISADMTTVTIKHMNIETRGKFICDARNDYNSQRFLSNVYVHALVKPKINKTFEEIQVTKGNDVNLTCHVIEGVPEPKIRWIFRSVTHERYVKLGTSDEVLHLKDVTVDNVGTYICEATNILGSELYAVDLYVDYPPIIKDANFKTIQVNEGDVVTIPCDVDANPSAKVKWLKNRTRLQNQRNIRVTRYHSLKFREIMVSDSGFYTCMANNKLGLSKKTVYVNVIVPVNIEIPKITTLDVMVGQSLHLPCVADGFPRPEIKWIYNDFRGLNPPKIIRGKINITTLRLEKIQLRDQGYYTCAANNSGGSTNITYDVKVNAPPVIENIYPDKTFRAVVGDMALIIHCKVTGSPTPTVVWKKDGLNIAAGTKWYDVENGTLIIRNIDKNSEGSYICLAKNKIGTDSLVYDLIVTDYPYITRPISTKYIENKATAVIGCDITHMKTDSLRWYKDHRLIQKGELILTNVDHDDEGVYSCRISNITKALSAHVEVKIGYRPVFLTDEPEFIDFVLDDDVPLICEATGDPQPEVSWTYNGKKLAVTEMTYDLHLMLDNRGLYTCTVSNVLGSIERNFSIITQDCIFDSRKDFLGEKKPLMLSSALTWPTFDVFDGYMAIKKAEPFYLHCTTGFYKFPTKYLTVFCEGGTQVKINGNLYEFSEIKCKEQPKLTIQTTEENCLPGNTEMLQVGYQVFLEFLTVFEVCINKDNNMTLYTKHDLSFNHYEAIDKELTEWTQNGLTTIDFDTIYDCSNQRNEIRSALITPSTYDGCCFDRRFLVNPKDFALGIPTTAAYTYLNAVPHWSTCNSKNWYKVEKKIRQFSERYEHDLIVMTGTGKPRYKSLDTYSKDIVLNDQRGNNLPVPQYIWKVVQDPESSKSLAIIQVNVPSLTPEDAPFYVHCRDICHEIAWMTGVDWHNVEDGYTYCCSIQSFETAFNYYMQFSNGKSHILDLEITPYSVLYQI